MKHKVSQLEGALLDAAVALADGKKMGPPHRDGWIQHISIDMEDPRFYRPSCRWELAGPIIERERMLICPDALSGWVAGTAATFQTEGSDDTVMATRYGDGPTPLVAAMRAFVASKFGEEVDIP